jgi:hypothetical protein
MDDVEGAHGGWIEVTRRTNFTTAVDGRDVSAHRLACLKARPRYELAIHRQGGPSGTGRAARS